MTLGVDAPGTICAFHNHGCSQQMLGHGGFDEHHEFPISLGGASDQTTMLALCPNHHRRQHALIRYLIENPNVPGVDVVVLRFTAKERTAAALAVSNWQAAGSPTIHQWPVPAAR